MDVLELGRAVGVEELAGEVDDGVALPCHADAGLAGDLGDDGRLEVLLGGVAHELVHVCLCDGYRHALLGLGDRELGAVQAVVLLGDHVEVDVEAVCQLAHGDGYAARAKVVAALDEAAGVAAAEQALQLALHGGVALLDLGAVLLDGLDVMGLGRAGGAADAVAAGASAQQDDLVAGRGALAADVACGGCAHHGADLHALGHVAGVIELGDLAGCKADLVAVGGVAGSGGGDQLALRQLAADGGGDGDGGVCGAGDAHGLVHVGASRKRVADGAAHAGRRAAERLDLGGVVVGLVLEEEQPILVLAVNVHGHLDGAGVDLLGLVQICEDALGFKPLGADSAHVHEADGLLVAAQLVAHLHVAVEGGLDHGVIDLDVLEHGAKGGVAAMVGPVGVDDADLGDGGIAVLVLKILLAKRDVRLVHGKAALGDEGGEAGLIELAEAVDDLDGLGLGNILGKGFGELERGQARFDGIHHVALDGLDVLVGQLAVQDIDLGGADGGSLALGDELDALAGGIRALVELAGQELHGERGDAAGGQLVVGEVHLGFGEHGGDAGAEQVLVRAFHVVTVNEAQGVEPLYAEDGDELAFKLLRLYIKAGFLLHVDARDH